MTIFNMPIAMPSQSTISSKDLLIDLYPSIRVYTDGTVERLFSYPYAAPTPDGYPATAVSSKDVTISQQLSARVYLPKINSGAKVPVVVYYHVGGFCLLSAFSSLDHAYLNTLAAAAGAIIVSVDYRLAPENPLPAGYEDAWDGLKWVCSHASDDHTADFAKDQWIADHADFTRVFVAGDSAGANIAHSTVLRAGSVPLPGKLRIRGLLLSHPFFLGSAPVENEPRENEHLKFLARLWNFVYPSAPGGIDNQRINPIGEGAPSLAGLGCSRIHVSVSDEDVLMARGLAYVAKLKSCGWVGEVEVVETEGEDHCFHVFAHESEKAKRLIKRMAEFISQ